MTVRHHGVSKNRSIMAEVPGRQQVVNAGLTAAAVNAITPLMGSVAFEELGKVKRLLKQFFSDQPWGPNDEKALADAVKKFQRASGGSCSRSVRSNDDDGGTLPPTLCDRFCGIHGIHAAGSVT